MNRTFLIARREYAAYAMTVGFWLSLLAFPLFAVLGGAVPILIKSSETVPAVALVEDGAATSGLAATVQDALAVETSRRRANALRQAAMAETQTTPDAGTEAADRVREIAESDGFDAGMAELRRVAPIAAAAWREPKPPITLAPAPAVVLAAAPGKARDDAARTYLSAGKKDRTVGAIVFLTRADGKPAARVWTARTNDDAVEDFVRDALKSANRREVFGASGVSPEVIVTSEQFRPQVTAYSPKASTGGEVSFRDRLPMLMGFMGGFLLWSLIITGASILLNSVMEEKSNKILEVLLSSASPTEILTGKVLGVAMLTLTMLLAWGGMGVGALAVFQPDYAAAVAEILIQGGMLAWFAAFMVGGYLMYAVLFAAIGAFCETPRDAQTLMGPIMMILTVPIMIMVMTMKTPDAPLVQILSWVPFFTPFLMVARLHSNPPLIELIGAMAGMFAFALLMVWLSGRAFRAGALSDVKLSWKSFGAAIKGGGN
ncbi:ABC transporter permease [Brevundimonas lenta]|uniref:ABC-2 type transport system permease protein n=1 Tax=Brevundimonas lenta TaxID=424796 RepID=A0A7W6JEC7_9CAUL|nr:ABC transporter permease [Brevundimonas lenta]MBB4083516.1 ABC-2 type transport system permease protein [Brevundimonas lenta]